MAMRCTCSDDPRKPPCDFCESRITRAEINRIDPGEDRADEDERFYEKDLDRIGGSL